MSMHAGGRTAHSQTHPCPGCGRPGIRYHQLACSTCWYALPEELRVKINRAWRLGAVGRTAHVRALEEAMTWFREHPV